MDVEVDQIQAAGQLAQALQSSGLNVSPPSTAAAKDNKIRAQLRGTLAAPNSRGQGGQP